MLFFFKKNNKKTPISFYSLQENIFPVQDIFLVYPFSVFLINYIKFEMIYDRYFCLGFLSDKIYLPLLILKISEGGGNSVQLELFSAMMNRMEKINQL